MNQGISSLRRGMLAGALCALLASSVWADVPRNTGDAVDQQISRLIEQLGDEQFAVRQRAQADLIKLGFDAFEALSEAELSDDPEIAMQAAYLVRLIRAQWTRETDPKSVQEVLKDYDLQPDDKRLARIKRLADLPNDQGLEWLCRLVRFEKSPVLSKRAALEIMEHEASLDDAARQRRATMIQKSLERARRPAAAWLLAYVQSQSDLAGGLDKWSALTEAERQTLDNQPRETHSQIVSELLRRKIDMLDRLGRHDETREVMHQMVLCERGDTASLIELIDWLAKRKAFESVDEAATRFATSFDSDALLMYALCDARKAQGKPELAEEIAAKALDLNREQAQEHENVAERLVDRGMIEWAQREWRHIISLGPIGSQTDVDSRRFLADSLHDRSHDLEAAELLKQLLDAADADAGVMQRVRGLRQQGGDTSPNQLRASMNFYFSCHADAQKDAAKRREYLEKALGLDRKNVDVMIAVYQITGAEPAKRAEVLKSIKDMIDECRSRIDDLPDEPTVYNQIASAYYNQIAWLIANTEGDIDEAIRMSHKSVDLARSAGSSPKRVGGLLDTLGHCYFAKKDYAAAVRYQTEAATLDPNTATIARQLKVFREALDRQQAEGK